MKTTTARAIKGRAKKITRVIVHRIMAATIAPPIKMASKLNMLPSFSPIAFWKASASLLKFSESSN